MAEISSDQTQDQLLSNYGSASEQHPTLENSKLNSQVVCEDGKNVKSLHPLTGPDMLQVVSEDGKKIKPLHPLTGPDMEELQPKTQKGQGNTICGIIQHRNGFLCFTDSRRTSNSGMYPYDSAIKLMPVLSDPNTIFFSAGSVNMNKLLVTYPAVYFDDKKISDVTMKDILSAFTHCISSTKMSGVDICGGILISNRNEDKVFDAWAVDGNPSYEDGEHIVESLQERKLVIGSGSPYVLAFLKSTVFPEEFNEAVYINHVTRACHHAYLYTDSVGGPLRVYNFENHDGKSLVTSRTISTFKLQEDHPKSMETTIAMLFSKDVFSYPHIAQRLKKREKKLLKKERSFIPSLWFEYKNHWVFRVFIPNPKDFKVQYKKMIKRASPSVIFPSFVCVEPHRRELKLASSYLVAILNDVFHEIKPEEPEVAEQLEELDEQTRLTLGNWMNTED